MNRTLRSVGPRKTPLATLVCTLGALFAAGGAQAQAAGGEAPAQPAAGSTQVQPAAGEAGTPLLEGLDSPLRPYYLRLSQTFSYDSNLFRTQDDEESEIISSTALTGGFEQMLGRQRLYGSAGVSGNLYQDNDQLDGTGYDLQLGLGWEVGSILRGNARVRTSQAQADFGNYGSFVTNRRDKNQEQSTVIDANALFGRGVIGLELLANRTDISYSRGGFTDRDRESNTVGAGVRLRPGGPWTFGLTARFTEGEYPDAIDLTTGERTPDDFDRRDIDLSAQYQATGQSILSARISHTDEEHDLVTARDFDGLTGALGWNYQATGKTSISVNLSRSTGTGFGSRLFAFESTDPLSPAPVFSPESVSYLTDARRSDTLSLGANWEATGRIVVDAGIAYSREKYDTRFVEGVGEDSDRTGNTFAMSLAASYYITRAWSASCGLGYERRETDISTSAGTFDYDSTTGFCGVALLLQ